MKTGKLISIIGILILGLLCYSVKSAAEQKPSRCSIKTSDVNVYELYSSLITRQFNKMSEDSKSRASFADVMKTMPKVIIFRNDSVFTYPSVTESDLLVEGFFQADLKKEDYIIVPGLGLGIDVDKYDVMYFCLEYSPIEKDRRLTILPMAPTWSSKWSFLGWLKDKVTSKKNPILYTKKLVSLSLNPISSTANLIEKILEKVPIISRIYNEVNHQLIQRAASVIDFAWLMLKKWTVDVGVYELEVRPKDMTMMYQVKIFNAVGLKAKKKVIKRETPLLSDKYFDEGSEIVVQP